jgi:hypothetical protein
MWQLAGLSRARAAHISCNDTGLNFRDRNGIGWTPALGFKHCPLAGSFSFGAYTTRKLTHYSSFEEVSVPWTDKYDKLTK